MRHPENIRDPGGLLRDITDFMFIGERLAPADVIFVPGGNYPEPAERAAQLWKEGLAPYIVPSGKYAVQTGHFGPCASQAEQYSGAYETECEFYTDVLLKCGVERTAILPENRATFTGLNAWFSKEVLDAAGIFPGKAILCCKAYHARRCLMYYQLTFPETAFMIANVSMPEEININRENWYKTPEGTARVFGELRRIGEQLAPEIEKMLQRRTTWEHTS